MSSLAYLPLDDRPCNTDFLLSFAKIAGIELNPAKNPAEFQALLRDCDAGIFSLDRWIYGGLVQSREFEPGLREANRRFLELSHFLNQKPGKNLYAFSVLLRESPNIFSEKEANLASLIKQASQSHQNPGKLQKILRKLSPGVWEKYQMTRKRNFEMNKKALSLVKKNNLSLLVFALDDLSPHGLNQKEYEFLRKRILLEKLTGKVHLLPGADEMGLLLFTRYFLQKGNLHPRIFPVPDIKNFGSWKPRYENLPLPELIKRQIELMGGKVTQSESQSDLLLFLHVADARQQDVPEKPTRKLSRSWFQKLKEGLEKEKKCILADLRYANGADAFFMRESTKNADYSTLYGFSAWNTTANALGIALSQGCARWGRERMGGFTREMHREHLKFLALRFLEDWLYQAEIRPSLTASLRKKRKSPFQLPQKLKNNLQIEVKSRLIQLAETYLKSCFPDLRIASIRFPWNRLFEISLDFIMNERDTFASSLAESVSE